MELELRKSITINFMLHANINAICITKDFISVNISADIGISL